MLFYVFLFFAIIIFTYLGNKNIVKNNSYIIFRILLVLLLSYLPSFGAMVATDHQAYVLQYEMCDLSLLFNNSGGFGENKASVEIGYTLLNYLGNMLNLGVPGFFFLVCCIINAFIVIVAYRFPMPAISLILFVVSSCYIQEANLVRQSIAISIFLYSIKYIESGDKWKYILFIFLAMSFHTSAILLLPLFFLSSIKEIESFFKVKKILFIFWLISFMIQLKLISVDLILWGFTKLGFISNIYASYIFDGHSVDFPAKTDIVYFYNMILGILAFSIKSDRYIPYIFIVIISTIFINLSFVIPILFRFGLYFTTLLPLICTFLCFSKKSYFRISKRYVHIFGFIIVVSYLYLYIKMYVFEVPLLGSKLYDMQDFFK